MNFSRRINAEPLSFPIAPMVDILLVLLCFFIVTWNTALTETDLKIKVPTASDGEENRGNIGEIIVNVKSDGGIVVQRQALTPAQLLEKLNKIVTLYPDQSVILRGDEAVNYKFIVAVLDICHQAKITNVAFATSKPESKK